MTTPIIPVAPTFVPPAGAVWVAGVARSPAGAIYITTADSEALLDIFRQMHSLHIQHLSATGRPLMWEKDFSLNLPSCNPEANSAWFTTGSGVRA